MSTMDDTPKPPKPPPLPTLPLRLVRPKPPNEVMRDLRDLVVHLERALEQERATVAVLRQQYQERPTGPHEETLPGVGASPKQVRAFEQRKRARRAPRARVWVPIVAALLGVAAAAAGTRYPGLMGPINEVAKVVTEALK